MIKWLKKLFANKNKILYDELFGKYSKLESDYLKVLHDFKSALQEKDAIKPLNYIPIKAFDIKEREFVRKIAVIQESAEIKFMLYDLKQQIVDRMLEGNVEVNIQSTGLLKGIDMVIKNLNGFKMIWDEIVQAEQKDAQI